MARKKAVHSPTISFVVFRDGNPRKQIARVVHGWGLVRWRGTCSIEEKTVLPHPRDHQR